MFEKNIMGVFDWIVYLILMVIPLVNIIIIILILVSPKANPSLKNLILAQLIFIAFFLIFFIGSFSTLIRFITSLQ